MAAAVRSQCGTASAMRRECRTVAAVRSQRRTVSERTSAYECGFQGQPYMGHYTVNSISTSTVRDIGPGLAATTYLAGNRRSQAGRLLHQFGMGGWEGVCMTSVLFVMHVRGSIGVSTFLSTSVPSLVPVRVVDSAAAATAASRLAIMC
jgi:hypothetical protein